VIHNPVDTLKISSTDIELSTTTINTAVIHSVYMSTRSKTTQKCTTNDDQPTEHNTTAPSASNEQSQHSSPDNAESSKNQASVGDGGHGGDDGDDGDDDEKNKRPPSNHSTHANDSMFHLDQHARAMRAQEEETLHLQDLFRQAIASAIELSSDDDDNDDIPQVPVQQDNLSHASVQQETASENPTKQVAASADPAEQDAASAVPAEQDAAFDEHAKRNKDNDSVPVKDPTQQVTTSDNPVQQDTADAFRTEEFLCWKAFVNRNVLANEREQAKNQDVRMEMDLEYARIQDLFSITTEDMFPDCDDIHGKSDSTTLQHPALSSPATPRTPMSRQPSPRTSLSPEYNEAVHNRRFQAIMDAFNDHTKNDLFAETHEELVERMSSTSAHTRSIVVCNVLFCLYLLARLFDTC